MEITLNDLTINPEGVDIDELLQDWTWAMSEPMRPVLLTALGDLFAQGDSGAVYFVDVIEGEIRTVAEDGTTFEDLLSDAEFVADHFFPARVLELRDAGIQLEANQVYSHQQPLVLGGNDELENYETSDVSVYISIQGQIHEQVKDLPEGTVISDVEIEDIE
ncbi:T6SS immunity protein Tdi1 domain-containing protein [Gimesia sp.]|uniref:T6SS immunity protein Tdi1 domain-containing protein n=1 Tax=Gimesia sp. TaxID=2024833 RepID=UPI003A8CB43D